MKRKIITLGILVFITLPLNTQQANSNVITITGNLDPRIIVAAVIDSRNWDSMRAENFNTADCNVPRVVAIAYRTGNTFAFHRATDFGNRNPNCPNCPGTSPFLEYNPNEPWRGTGEYFLAFSDTMGQGGNQWITSGFVFPNKHNFNGRNDTLPWNRFNRAPNIGTFRPCR